MYEFGPFRQDPLARTLTRQGTRVAIAPKAFDTLLYLVSNAGKTVTREEIIRAVWPDTFVEEGNLNYNISQLRKILGESAPGFPYIQTLPKQGYRFVANVSQAPANGSDLLLVPSLRDDGQALQAAPPRRFLWLRAALALSVLGLTIAVAPVLLRNRVTTPERAANLVRVTSDSGLAMTPALSRDGGLIAFASDRGGEGNLNIWVQQVGGAAIRITHAAADDYSPSFSPSGREIAFRSEREGGGIYIVSSLGGEEKKVAPFGRRPRYSPDGKWIAYWVGTDVIGVMQTNFPGPGLAKIYIVPSAGGAPREVRPDFASAAYPTWTPDGRHLLFLGNRDPNLFFEPTGQTAPAAAGVDWWVTPMDGGPAVATGANAAFRALGLTSLGQIPEAWTEDGAGVLMSAALADTHNLWRVPISPGNWKVSGVPRRLTFGTSMDLQPSVAAGNTVAFASLTGSMDVWSVALEPGPAGRSGSPQRLTTDAFDHSYPAVSADGTKIAYSSRRAGARNLWVRDLATGKETDVSAPQVSALIYSSAFSTDGGKVAYRAVEGQKSVIYVASLADGSRDRVSEGIVGSVAGWSSDGKRLLFAGPAPTRISMVDLASKRTTELLNHAAWRLWNPRFSPDDRWVAFNATTAGGSRIFAAPFRTGGPIPEAEWIAITKGVWDDKPRWSPDGDALYFMSERDGFRCIWLQRLDASKHPVGEAIPVFHAHEARRSLLNVAVGPLEMSVARDKIVFNMSERTGNVWMMKLSDRK
jgi:Tol biopolymer transport system component/DNA-binding winged helix-turn-helix (wHTH) protein